jgi:hypothetical protein
VISTIALLKWDGSAFTDAQPLEDLTVQGSVTVGPGLLRWVAHASDRTLSLESPEGMLMLSSRLAPHVNANSWWDGQDWLRFDTAQPLGNLIVQPGALTYRVAPAGDNPIAAWTTPFNVDSAGNLTVGGLATVGSLQCNGGGNFASITVNGGGPASIDGAGNASFNGFLSVAQWMRVANGLATDNGSLFFRSDNGVSVVWDGANLRASVGFVTNGNLNADGGHLWMAGHWLRTTTGIWDTDTSFSANGDLRAVGRLITNNWDVGSANSLGGAAIVGGEINAHGRIYAMAQWGGALANDNCFLAPNIGDNRGQALAYSWGTWSSVDHAVEYGLRLEPIPDALSAVRSLKGYSYDHAHFGPNARTPLRRADGQVVASPTYGFKASEVARLLPELVGRDPQTGEPQSVDLDRLGVILWEAFKHYTAATDARLDALEAASTR